ncbi:MAG: glycosyltransferase [Desmonostoc vinosum HA7617-LM4]|nr:glycosyltransferase [Desmonostoc vinosum HA7617-LM4]
MQKREISVSKFSYQTFKAFVPQRVIHLRIPTLILLGIISLFSIILAGWFAKQGSISEIFAQIHAWQQQPPMWLEPPKVTAQYLLAPTVILLLVVYIVMKISPQPRVWSHRLVVGILIFLTLRYFIWRSLSTLNVADPLNGLFSLGLLFLEIVMLVVNTLQLFFMLNIKDRQREADEKSLAVIHGSFNPSVDILIPTYNEPEFILRRTIIGCQALDYANKKIYLLDDTQRPEIRDLAAELGCKYITRLDNSYAKAGNLNHALANTNSELIVVFDADFIPTKNFLTRTVGFFQNEKIGLVQTPQNFYNTDPIAHNLGLENLITSDEEIFYRLIQPMKDAAGSVICSGTSFVVRRSALEASGGFVIDSLSEDYFTGIHLTAQGHNVIYLNEKLSAGLAAENIAGYVTQRLRWARGTLQGFFIKSNPLTIPGLSIFQRLAHFEGFLGWFTCISRVYFLLMPLAFSFLGVIPIKATLREIVYFWLPFSLVSLTTYAWLNKRSRSAFLSDIYFLVICFPLAFTVIQVMLNPFSKGFKVTPKGIATNRYHFNWKLALPLIILFISTTVSLWLNLSFWMTTRNPEIAEQIKGISLGWVWSAYNLMMICIALLSLIDAPRKDIYEWFDLQRVVRLKVGKQNLWGVTTMMSEVGAEIALTQIPTSNLLIDQLVNIELVDENLQLSGEIVRTGFNDESPTVRVRFESVSLNQHRRLIEMLFCRPGQWKRQEIPGEFGSFLLLFKILLKPRVLFKRKGDISAIAVSKV